MAYQAGKQEITIDSKRYPTGAILPTTAVERMPNLRQLLNGGWVLCDYKNGERRPEQLPHNGSTILEDSVIVEALAVLGIQVPEEQTKPIYSEDGRDTGRVEIVRKAAPRAIGGPGGSRLARIADPGRLRRQGSDDHREGDRQGHASRIRRTGTSRHRRTGINLSNSQFG